MSNSRHRSYRKITQADLRRLVPLAMADFDNLFQRKSHSRPYRSRLFLLCLCQGAARHYVYGDRGIQDFDVWGFFRPLPGRSFPYRRRGEQDFGASKFGRNPDDGERLKGRRVDVIGRSIPLRHSKTPIEAVQRYVRKTETKSARCLAERPVIALWPRKYFGRTIWDID